MVKFASSYNNGQIIYPNGIESTPIDYDCHDIDNEDNLAETFKKSPYYEGNGRIILRDIRPYYSCYNERKICEFGDFVGGQMWKYRSFRCTEEKFVFHTIDEICDYIVETETATVDEKMAGTVRLYSDRYGINFHNICVGQKVTRLVKKICGLVKLETHKWWDKYYATFCDAVNALATRKTIIFSINEDDMKIADNWYHWMNRKHYNTVMFMLDSFNGNNIDCMPYATIWLNGKKPGKTLHDGLVKEMLEKAFCIRY